MKAEENIEAVIQRLGQYGNSKSTLERDLKTLLQCVQKDKVTEEDINLVQVIGSVIKKNIGLYENITEEALLILDRVSEKGEYDAEKEEEKVTWALNAMRRWQGARSMQLVCLKILKCCAEEYEIMSMVIAEKGGVPEVVTAMRRYKDDRRVQCLAIEAIAALTKHNVENRRAFIELQVIKDILIAIDEVAENDLSIANVGCRALRFICFDKEAGSHLSTHGGIHILCRVLMRIPPISSDNVLPQAKEAVINALLALNNGVYENETNQLLVSKTYLEDIMAFIDDDEKATRVTTSCLRLLRNLTASPHTTKSSSPSIQTVFGRQKACCQIQDLCDKVVQVLITRKETPEVVDHSCALLYNILSASQRWRINVNVSRTELYRNLEQARDLHCLNEQVVVQISALAGVLQGNEKMMRTSSGKSKNSFLPKTLSRKLSRTKSVRISFIEENDSATSEER